MGVFLTTHVHTHNTDEPKNITLPACILRTGNHRQRASCNEQASALQYPLGAKAHACSGSLWLNTPSYHNVLSAVKLLEYHEHRK